VKENDSLKEELDESTYQRNQLVRQQISEPSDGGEEFDPPDQIIGYTLRRGRKEPVYRSERIFPATPRELPTQSTIDNTPLCEMPASSQDDPPVDRSRKPLWSRSNSISSGTSKHDDKQTLLHSPAESASMTLRKYKKGGGKDL